MTVVRALERAWSGRVGEAIAALAPLAAVPGVRPISLQARHRLFQLGTLPPGPAGSA